MCDQDNCQHQPQQSFSERDLRVTKAFAASIFMRIFRGTMTAEEAVDWMLKAGACSIACDNESCGVDAVLGQSLQAAVDHVDHGEDLEVVSLYNEHGLLVDGKKETIKGAILAMFRGQRAPQVDPSEVEGIVDTVIVDDVASANPISEPNSMESGRMVGAARGRRPELLN